MTKVDLKKAFVVAISSSALFDLSVADRIFRESGLAAYKGYQRRWERKILDPGTAFELVRAILSWNNLLGSKRNVEVIIVSRNDIDTSIRIFNSVQSHGLDISRGAFTGGAPATPYLSAYCVDLFLSTHEGDVFSALEAGVPAGLIYSKPDAPMTPVEQVRFAFDGDCVLVSDEAEQVYQQQGLEAFREHEEQQAGRPLSEGPFTKLLRTLSVLQGKFPDTSPIRTALVTARGNPAHERIARTFRAWNVRVDEAFFMDGSDKSRILEAFAPHIFFDDQEAHCKRARRVVPTARVLSSPPAAKTRQ